MIRVVTIAREYASGGGTVGRLLAEQLGWRLLDRELVAEIARSVDVQAELAEKFDEKVDPWIHRLAKQAFRYGTVDRPSPLVETGIFDSETMTTVGTNVIREAARIGGCVVVGRGGQCILHGVADVFHVFLYAPMRQRLERAAGLLGKVPDLEQRIREKDRQRAAGVRHYFGQDWCNPNLYDLMLDTSCGVEVAVETVLCAARLRAHAAVPSGV